MDPAAPRADFRLGDWLVEPTLNRISRGGRIVHLRPRLMDLLVFLARNAGRVVTKDEIIAGVRGREFITESVLSRSVADLRQLLADDAEKPRFIETIPRRGYRLIVGITQEAVTPSIAVLPFTDMVRERDQEYFCDGLAEELTNALTRLRGLRVIARTSAFAFKGKAVDVREIGRQLGVGAVLEGGVQRSGDRLRITVQLINVADGSHLWSDRFDRRSGDVFAIQDEVAGAVVKALSLKLLGDDQARLLRRHTEDVEAHDLYLRGRYICARRTPEAMAKAVRCFERAQTKDPGYARAYAALGECYDLMGYLGFVAPQDAFPQAKAAAKKALDLDPTLAEGHAVLGWANWAYDWEWLEAENRFLRAEELSPSYALARVWHAQLLAVMGRFDEAVAESGRARQLDPFSPVVDNVVAMVWFEARQYDRSIEHWSRIVEMDPDFALAQWTLGRAYSVLGRYQEALATLEKAAPVFPLAMAFLARTYAKLGRPDKAEEILRQLERLSAERYVGPMAFADVYVGLGDIDAALDWLEKSLDAREGLAPYLNMDPGFDPLRSDPRFTELLKRLKLPPTCCGHA